MRQDIEWIRGGVIKWMAQSVVNWWDVASVLKQDDLLSFQVQSMEHVMEDGTTARLDVDHDMKKFL
ncbi:MAG: hypothetical protein R2813_01820 [Flavobacteriales bacterium]